MGLRRVKTVSIRPHSHGHQLTHAAFVVARQNGDPAVPRRADALAGAAIVIGFPGVLLTARHWRSLTIERSRDR